MKINANDPNNLNQKPLSEKETRKRLLQHAKLLGCEHEMLNMFKQTDMLLSKCTNAKEAEDIKKLGVISVYRLLGGGGELYINNTLVCKDD